MKNFVAACLLLSAVAVATPGCYKTMDNRSKMGVPFTKDKIAGQYERNYKRLHDQFRNGTPYAAQMT